MNHAVQHIIEIVAMSGRALTIFQAQKETIMLAVHTIAIQAFKRDKVVPTSVPSSCSCATVFSTCFPNNCTARPKPELTFSSILCQNTCTRTPSPKLSMLDMVVKAQIRFASCTELALISGVLDRAFSSDPASAIPLQICLTFCLVFSSMAALVLVLNKNFLHRLQSQWYTSKPAFHALPNLLYPNHLYS